jgi:hypothetical protein
MGWVVGEKILCGQPMMRECGKEYKINVDLQLGRTNNNLCSWLPNTELVLVHTLAREL